ncbi:alpha/beta hydrolase [Candidatus Riflebacteria bacterium]
MEVLPIIKYLARLFVNILLMLVIMVYPFLYFFQESLIFISRSMDPGILQWAKSAHPDAEITFTTPDGIKLHGWLVKNSKAKQLPLVIYFGGNAEEVTGFLQFNNYFKDWALLLVNYRSYGLSEGKPGQDALFKDALHIFDEMAKREDIDAKRILAFGRSLGCGVAVHLASKKPLKGIILVSPYDSITKVAQAAYFYAPVSLLLKHPFECLSMAPLIKIPLLGLYAKFDEVISSRHSKRLIEAWGGAKETAEIENYYHNTITDSKKYWQVITKFMERMRQ